MDAPEVQYEVDEYHEKRSLTANSYYHALKHKLASVLKTTPDELHYELIKRNSVVDEDLPPVTIRADLPIERMPGYWIPGRISSDGKWQSIIKLKGSSEMDSKEFSRLLDGLIDECEEVGIATLTEDEVRRLRGYAPQNESNTNTDEG